MQESIRKTKFLEEAELFLCPLCQEKMHLKDEKDLECGNRHNFNIAKKGYVNFMSKTIKTNYDEKLFQARREVFASGFFQEVLDELAEILQERMPEARRRYLLDAGSGSGDFLGQLLRLENLENIKCLGLDISKDGILEASKNYYEPLWLVGDLANLPLKDASMDFILNILSPANYAEFKRVLTADGYLLKLIPAREYLQELRTYFYPDSQDYSNAEVVSLLEDNFLILQRKKVFAKKLLNSKNLAQLLEMTPLTWHIAEEEKKKFLDKSAGEITLDLEILICQKK